MSLPKKDLVKLIDSIVGKWATIRNKLNKDNAGGRLFPSRTPTHDKAAKGRLDQGELLPKKDKNDKDEPERYNVNVQANDQGSASHRKLFTIQVEKGDTGAQVKQKLMNGATAKGLL